MLFPKNDSCRLSPFFIPTCLHIIAKIFGANLVSGFWVSYCKRQWIYKMMLDAQFFRSLKSASITANSFSSFAAFFDFQATIKRTLAAVT